MKDQDKPGADQNPPGRPDAGACVPADPTLVQAAQSLAEIIRPQNPAQGVTEMILELHRCYEQDGNCETLLFLQARLLDSMFNRLVLRAFQADQAHHFNDEAVNLALRAQRQCRTAIDVLSVVRARQDRKFENELKARKKDRDNNWF